MSALRLTLRERPARGVDLSPLVPDRVAGLSAGQVAAIELSSGNRTLRVDLLFRVSGDPGDELEILDSCDRLDRIGEGMSRGRIRVRGDAGAYVGSRMRGGRIRVEGSVGVHAATAMREGLLHVTGSAGDHLAASLPGEESGVRGGTVVVEGDAGDRVGDRMRRGMVLVAGDAGDFCASRIIAGTIAVLGRIGRSPCAEMRRGTLLLANAPREILPTFNDCGLQDHAFLTLLVRSWRGLPGAFATLSDARVRARRFVGDLAAGGRGEILVWA